MKRIYVAGASAEIGLIIEVTRSLREAGWTITYDWTEAVSAFGSAGEELTNEAKESFARKDLMGVAEADVFWMLAPQNRSVGAWIELGSALTWRAMRAALLDAGVDLQINCVPSDPVVVVVSGATDSIFALLADKRFATHDEALAWLCINGDKS